MASTAAATSALGDFLRQEEGIEPEENKSAPEGGGEKPGKARTYRRPGGGEHLARRISHNAAEAENDVELLRVLRERQIFCQLIGPPGSGKTSLVEAAFGEEVETVVCSEGTDEDSLLGGYRPDPELQWRRVEGAVVRALREGKVLYLDEVAALHPRVSAKLHGVFDGRLEVRLDQFDGEIVRAEAGFYSIVSFNPGPEFELSEAMQSRFAFKMRVGTDLRTAERLGVPKRAVKLAGRLYKLADSGGIVWTPQLRELVAYRDIEALLGESWALQNLIGQAPDEEREQVIEEAQGIYDGVRTTPLAL
jgi:nitric oxide reductase NorQ protein